MLNLTLGKFYLDLRALCSFVLVNGRFGLRRPLAPFALFRLSEFFEFTPYSSFGKPLLVLDNEDLLALETAAMLSSFRARFEDLGGILLLQNLNAPPFLLRLAQQHDLALLCTPFGDAVTAHTLAAYFQVYAHSYPVVPSRRYDARRAEIPTALLPEAGRRQAAPFQNNFLMPAV